MYPVPITYLFDFEFCTEKMRPFIMEEFAANGARHLVLSDVLISQCMQNPRLKTQLTEEIAQAGLTFVDAHAPFGTNEDLNVPDPRLRSAMLDRLKLALRITAEFGVDSITIHTGNAVKEWRGYSLQQLHDALLASLEVLLPIAEELGITIAIENIWFPNNTPEKLLDAVHHFHSPCLGICYDSGHATLMKCDRGFADDCAPVGGWKDWAPLQWDDHILEKLHPEITTCHLHDNIGQYDQHKTPGCGNIDWPHVVGLLKTAPRLKCIQCETILVRTHSSIADICRTMQRLFA